MAISGGTELTDKLLWLTVASTAAASVNWAKHPVIVESSHVLRGFQLFWNARCLLFFSQFLILSETSSLLFAFFGGSCSQLGRTLHLLVPNPYSNLGVKSVLKAKTCASKTSCMELWVSPESHGNHKIKLAFICCECGSLVKSLLKRFGISTLEIS